LYTLKQLKKSWYLLFFQLPYLPENHMKRNNAEILTKMYRGTSVHKENFSDPVIDVYKNNALKPGAMTAMINWYRAAFRAGLKSLFAKSKPIKKIEIPTLVIWGERDIAMDNELTFGMEKHVQDLTLRYIADSSHWAHQDTPASVNEIVEAWLTGKPVPGEDQPREKLLITPASNS